MPHSQPPTTPAHRLAYQVQLGIVATMLIGLVALALASPPAARIRLLISASIVLPLSFVISRRRQPDGAAGGDLLYVFLASGLAFMMPLAFNAPIPGVAAAGALLGLLIAESIWAIHRYPVRNVRHPAPLGQRVAGGIKSGLIMAVLFSGLATVIIVIGLFAEPAQASVAVRVWLLIIAGYLVGGLSAGALVGALRPIMAWPLGVILAGILGGFLVYGAIAPSVALLEAMEGPPEPVRMWVMIAAICGFAAGPPAAIGLTYSDARKYTG